MNATPKLEIAFDCPPGLEPGVAPTVVATGAAAADIGAISPPLPTGWAVDDIFVLFLETQNQAITVAGWTEASFSPQSQVTDGIRLTVFWKRAAAGDVAPTTSDSGDHQMGRIIAVRGCKKIGNPFNSATGGNDSTSSTAGSIAGAVTTVPNCLTLWALVFLRDLDTSSNFTAWTNAGLASCDEQMDNGTSQGLGGALGVATGVKVAAGDPGTTTVTLAVAGRKAFWFGALMPYQWTDVSADLQQHDIHRGKSRELDRVEAGTGTFVLENLSRDYDPTYVSSPYYPYVIPRRHIRFTEAGGSAVYRGFVESWPQTWPDKFNSQVTIQTSDFFNVLANIDQSKSVWEREWRKLVAAGSVRAWYRCNDPIGATRAVDSGPNGHDAVVTDNLGTPIFGQESALPFGDPSETGVTFRGSGYISPPEVVFPQGTQYTVEMIIQRDNSPAVAGGGEDLVNWTAYNNATAIYMASDGSIGFIIDLASLIFAGLTSRGGYADGQRHHVACVRTWNGVTGSALIYVDGVLKGTLAVNNGGSFTATQTAIGTNSLGATDIYFHGTIQDVIFSDTPFDAATIATHASWALTPDEGIDTGTAVGNELTAAGIPSALQSIATGATLIQRHALGQKVLEFCQQMTETEAGLFFVNKSGVVTFYSRDRFVTAPGNVSQMTFGDDDNVEAPYADISLQFDELYIWNEALTGRQDGPTFLVKDQASQDLYFRRTYEKTDLLDVSDYGPQDRGNWIVSKYKNPRTEIRSITVNLQDPRITVANVLALELGDLITINRRPVPLGSTIITEVSRIVGIDHSGNADQKTWTVTFMLQDWTTTIDQPWLLGDTTYGVLDTTTRLGY